MLGIRIAGFSLLGRGFLKTTPDRRSPGRNIVFLALLSLLFAASFNEGFLAAQESGAISVSEVVLFGIRSPTELKEVMRPKISQACVQRYLAAIPEKSGLWDFKPPTSSDDAPTVRRRNIIEQITVIHGEAARNAAEAFGAAAPLLGEWEGMRENPLAEAGYAEQWLKEHPGTAIAPFLHLFVAHRLRACYEAAGAGHEEALRPTLAERYKDSLCLARTSGNDLISCIADDLDAQPYVYLEGQGRP